MDSDKKYVLLYISLIAGVVSLVAFIILRSTAPVAAGTTLNEQYLSTLRTSFIVKRLGDGFLYMFIFSAGAAIAFFLRHVLDNPKLVFAGILILILGITMSAVRSSHAIAPIFNKPEAATVTVVDKNRERRGGKVKRWYYNLYFSNGSNLAVAVEKYDRTNLGDEYYVVMCGSEPIAAYSASEYRLP